MEERPGSELPIRAAQSSVDAAKRRLEVERNESAKREWGNWLSRLRENPLFRNPMKGLAALFLGIPLSASAAEIERPSMSPEPTDAVAMIDAETPNPMPERVDETAPDESVLALKKLVAELNAEHPNKLSSIQTQAIWEARTPETDDFYKWNLAVIGKTIEGGQAAPEYYARVGRPEWTPYQRALFADAPVTERFAELHPEYRDQTPEQFLQSYPEMIKIAKTEFRFSNEFRFLTDDAIRLFAQEAPEMEPAAALERYKILMQTIGTQVGLAKVIELSSAVTAALPPDHPIVAYDTFVGVNEASTFVGRSKKNVVHMDQANGELRVLRTVDDQYVLVDSFPAIGGNLEAPALSLSGKPTGSEYVHVPDTSMTVAYVDRAKTSWSWHNSWVPQGAPIREKGDELQYQHPRTKQWYDLTGPNAAFFPDKNGALIQPFDARVQPMDIGLIRAATHRSADGIQTFVPKAWTKDEILSRNGGELPTEWTWNDFGSMAVRLSVDGKQTNINIHSKPGEDENDFLGVRTHGCFSTYGEYLKTVVDRYGVGSGSEVVVTTKRTYDLDEIRRK